MAGKAYNGFPPEFRRKGGSRQSSAFRRDPSLRPTECLGCGGTKADGYTIHAHLEDYHEPIAGILGTCMCCHYAVHRRFDQIGRWFGWLSLLNEGWKPPPTSNGEMRLFYRTWEATPIGAEQPSGGTYMHALPLVEPNLYRGPLAPVSALERVPLLW